MISLSVCVCVQRDTVLILSESQTANYKNPTATSPSLSLSASLASYLARPSCLIPHLSLSLLSFSLPLFLSIFLLPSLLLTLYINLCFINKALLR